jgi:tRNA (cmo5U34)-methyltransferase
MRVTWPLVRSQRRAVRSALKIGGREMCGSGADTVGPVTNAPQSFDEIAGMYDASRRRLIPPLESFYRTAVAALRLGSRRPERVLDLGAGTGMLGAFIRAEFPQAQLTLLDGAPRMLAQARAKLGEDGITYLEADLMDPLPPGPWDAIVSALAIHHLPDAHKVDVYRRVRAALAPGGVFVNAEHVAAPSPALEAEYDRWHEARARAAGSDDAEWAHAVRMMAHDERATVEQQLAWLRDSGFLHADCLLKEYSFAVLVALP